MAMCMGPKLMFYGTTHPHLKPHEAPGVPSVREDFARLVPVRPSCTCGAAERTRDLVHLFGGYITLLGSNRDSPQRH